MSDEHDEIDNTEEEKEEQNTTAIIERTESEFLPQIIDFYNVDVTEIKKGWNIFQQIKRDLLNENDWTDLETGKRSLNKSAFRKFKTFYRITDKIISKTPHYLLDGSLDYVEFVVVAYPAMLPEYKSVCTGYCEARERCFYEDKKIKNKRTGMIEIIPACPSDGSCNWRKHWSHPIHDIFSTAHTRAKNRAISDLLAGGEVSAEELTSYSSSSAPRGKPNIQLTSDPEPTVIPTDKKDTTTKSKRKRIKF